MKSYSDPTNDLIIYDKDSNVNPNFELWRVKIDSLIDYFFNYLKQ